MVLQKLNLTPKDFLGKEVKDAIVTVPVLFNDSQRKPQKTLVLFSDLMF